MKKRKRLNEGKYRILSSSNNHSEFVLSTNDKEQFIKEWITKYHKSLLTNDIELSLFIGGIESDGSGLLDPEGVRNHIEKIEAQL